MADYSFFSNKDCQYFPCHNNVDPENFNCLFCYCPLYALGSKCGGNFYYTEKGIKSCERCGIPHSSKGYSYILSKFPEIKELAENNQEK